MSILIQNVFKEVHAPIQVAQYPDNKLSPDILDDFLAIIDGHLGMAPSYDRFSRLAALAFATSERVLVVQFSYNEQTLKKPHGKTQAGARRLLFDRILGSATVAKFALRMDVLATSLFQDLKLYITNAVDMLSVVQETRESRHSVAALLSVFSGEQGLNRPRLLSLFRNDTSTLVPFPDLALQAWALWRAATLSSKLDIVPRIDTRAFSNERLLTLGRLVRTARGMNRVKPTRVENEVDTGEFTCKGNKLQVTSTRFKTRIMQSSNQRVEVQGTVLGTTTTFTGRTRYVDGRAAQIALTSNFEGNILRVTTIGREEPTKLEKQREQVVLQLLQRTQNLFEHPFFQSMWLPDETPSWRSVPSCGKHQVPLYFPHTPLNDSQKQAVEAILSGKDEHRLTVIQGPPGTGKTSVIATVVSIISSSPDKDRTAWVVAQSNVAVKNIAEKLAKVDCDFTLLVSKEFHYDWHEHLYEKIVDNLVRSDELTDDFVALEKRFLGSRVVLCTLGMLCHSTIATITRLIPFQTLIVDEASQVEIGSYLPLLHAFAHSIRKMVFIGDDKQLPPHGSNQVDGLQSVFELDHLRAKAIFLDTQYRMPEQIGKFIGKHVYHGRLKSVHPLTMPRCQFINTEGTEVPQGRSWINIEESKTILAQAKEYQKRGRSYRILTPYDAQRGLIERGLREADLLWHNKVFCVDSFQGNEDDYILISIVRTEKIGFLSDARRVNVMLSRCKRGLVVCANRAFIENQAGDTLVGELAAACDGWNFGA